MSYSVKKLMGSTVKGTEYMHLSRYPSRAGPTFVLGDLVLTETRYTQRSENSTEPANKIGYIRGVK